MASSSTMPQSEKGTKHEEATPVTTTGSKCFLCKPDDVTSSEFDLSKPLFGFQHCGKRSDLEISSFNELLRAEVATAIKDAKQHDKSRIPANTAPKRPPGTELPYRQADYIVQNLPPGSSDPTTSDSQVLATEKILNLAWAWGQLEVANNSLSVAYETLKGFDKNDLPARTLKKRMKEVRKVTKGMVDLVDGKAAGGDGMGDPKGEDKKEGNGEGNGDEKVDGKGESNGESK